ncbi:MAG: hypothetical protein ACLTHV_06095 [Parasutterella excrementihominis]
MWLLLRYVRQHERSDAYLLYYGRRRLEKLFEQIKRFWAQRLLAYIRTFVKAKMLVEFIALIIRQRIYCLQDEMLSSMCKNHMTVPTPSKVGQD